MRIEEMIAAIQQELGIDDDGRAGPQTWGAISSELTRMLAAIDASVAAHRLHPNHACQGM